MKHKLSEYRDCIYNYFNPICKVLDHGEYVKQGKKEPVERSPDGESFTEVLPGEKMGDLKTLMLAGEFTFDNTVNKVL